MTQFTGDKIKHLSVTTEATFQVKEVIGTFIVNILVTIFVYMVKIKFVSAGLYQ